MTLDEFAAEWFGPESYIIAHTSGSTGTPKQVRLAKEDMRLSARATNAFFDITERSVLAIPLSLDYIAGKMMAVRAFEAGASLDVIEPSRTFTLPRRASLLSVVPVQVPRLLQMVAAGDESAFPLVDDVIVGGAPLMPEAEAALTAVPWRTWVSYGMTETCSHVALRRVGDDCYHAMPGISFDTDSRGCLVVEAPAFSFGRLVTNDVVTLYGYNGFRWEGRIDNVINSGAMKLHPELIERAFAAVVGVPFYVLGVPHPIWGQCVAMVAEGKSSEAISLIASLRGHVRHEWLPKKIWMVDALPRTDTGKVRRIVPEGVTPWTE